ncbi:MAG TPA: hypothetical protein VF177_21750 [Anaerolineae bacterium]
MKPHHLNSRQKALLRTLVNYTNAGKIKETIVPIPFGEPTRFAILVHGEDSYIFRRISDLDALCDAGYMRYRWNRQGLGKIYTITEAGFTAVAGDFQTPPPPIGFDVNIAELIHTMSGDTLKVSGLDESIELSQLSGDPVLRHTTVDALASQMLKEARFELSWADFMIYEKGVRRLKEELFYTRPSAARLQELARILAGLGEIKTSMAFTLQAWTYLYPLLLIGATRIEQEAAKHEMP